MSEKDNVIVEEQRKNMEISPDQISHSNDTPEYYIVAGTWNAAKSKESYKEIHTWLKCISQSIYHSEMAQRNEDMRSSGQIHGHQSLKANAPFQVPDIVAIGIQEWTGLFRSSHPNINIWCEEIQQSLEANFPTAKYDIVRYTQWVGLALIIAIKTPSITSPKISSTTKDQYSFYLKSIHSSYVGTGPIGIGNKGAVGMMVHLLVEKHGGPDKVSDITLCFVSSHLTPNSGFIKDRRSSYRQICHMMRFPMPVKVPITTTSIPTSPNTETINNAHISIDIPSHNTNREYSPNVNNIHRSFIEINSVMSIFDADIIIWMGDLNYRLYDPSFNDAKRKKHGNTFVGFDPQNPSNIKDQNATISKVAPEASSETILNITRPQFTTKDGNIEPIPIELRISPRPNPNQYYPSPEQFNMFTTISQSRISEGSGSPGINVPSTPNFYSDLTVCIYAREWDKLLKYDQLSFDRRNGLAFGEFSEARITFPPTYKYSHGSNYLNIEDWKLHWPAWCDRILFTTKSRILKNNISLHESQVSSNLQDEYTWTTIPLLYNSCTKVLASDHKPVYALFKVTLSKYSDEEVEHDKSKTTLFAPFTPRSPSPSENKTNIHDPRSEYIASRSLVASVYQTLPTTCDNARQNIGFAITKVLMIPKWIFVISFITFVALLMIILINVLSNK